MAKYKITKSNKYVDGGPANEFTVYGSNQNQLNPLGIGDTNIMNTLVDSQSDAWGQKLYDIGNANNPMDLNLNATQQNNNSNNWLQNQDWDKIGGEAMRYAPAAISGARALFGDFTPEETSFARHSAPTQVNPEQISETKYDSLFNSMQNKSTKDVINVSGGSGAAARANIAGSNANLARKKSDMINDIVKYNLGQKSQADYYNAGNADRVNQMNTQIGMQESIANEQNKAAAAGQKNQAWNDFIGSLSGIGTEMYQGRMIDKMTPNVNR